MAPAQKVALGPASPSRAGLLGSYCSWPGQCPSRFENTEAEQAEPMLEGDLLVRGLWDLGDSSGPPAPLPNICL